MAKVKILPRELIPPYSDYIHQYWHSIQTGEAKVGKWIHLLYEKITDGLKDGTYHFAQKAANKAITFIQNFCHHSKGRSDLITLELWQRATVSLMFGIVDEDGVRQFRETIIIVGRKNGKSAFASAIQAYMAYMDGEYGAEIYDLAPKLDQAEIVYGSFYSMVQAEPELLELAKKRRSDIYIAESNTVIKPLAFNARKSDGFNPHLVICDEIASWPAAQGLKQYEVMKSALGARTQPMILSISTAGYVSDGIYDELIARGTAWLQGTSQEHRILPIFYIIDDPEKWDDIEELQKSNPNMGVSIKESFYEEEIAVAHGSLSKKIEFLTKYCNIKQSSVIAWLPFQVVADTFGDEFSLDDFRDSYCVGGIDLSQTTDLTACGIIIERDGKLFVFVHFFMPANKISELQASEGVPYDIYIKQGVLSPSGENFVDYHDCFDWFKRLIEEYHIYPLKVGYDRFSAQYLVQDMTNYGFQMDDVFQGENLSPVIHEAEGLMRDGTLRYGVNHLLQAHIMNTATKSNVENRKLRLVKVDSRVHIDGCLAVIDALTVRQKWYDQIGAQLKNAG